MREAHLLGVTHRSCLCGQKQWWVTPSANPPYAGSPALIHHVSNGLAASRRVGVATEIPGPQRAFRQRALDRLDDRFAGFLLAEMLEHHRARPDHADRVG